MNPYSTPPTDGHASPEATQQAVDEFTNAFLTRYPLHCELREQPLGQSHLHAHDGYELYFCLKGTGIFLAGDRMYPMAPGTLTLVKPRVLHMPRPAGGEPFHRYVLSLGEPLADGLQAHTAGFAEAAARLWGGPEASCAHWHLPPALLLEVRSLLASLERETGQRLPLFGLAVEHLLTGLFLVLARAELQPASPGPLSDRELAGQVIELLTRRYRDETLEVGELCRSFPLSRSRMFALFKRTTGYTMNGFLTAYRLHQAKELLRHTGLPVTAIAGESGFGDMSHFYHTFKKHTGLTPKAYRLEQQGKACSRAIE
ncbi:MULTISPECIES: AraC family transcriptional regulator [Paenibacillus]|uniref:AraC family transcriptional regulator n=1 Tax=Paenibacillus TaxID=44249 RepID=UPI0022B8DECA|nr:helix-turn-helix domain-containing protein [Paenibacillus caseinilyticus]MCZ8523442.1 AraC family transcriptional regulator [Paenibacillus caseinilyticus]